MTRHALSLKLLFNKGHQVSQKKTNQTKAYREQRNSKIPPSESITHSHRHQPKENQNPEHLRCSPTVTPIFAESAVWHISSWNNDRRWINTHMQHLLTRNLYTLYNRKESNDARQKQETWSFFTAEEPLEHSEPKSDPGPARLEIWGKFSGLLAANHNKCTINMPSPKRSEAINHE